MSQPPLRALPRTTRLPVLGHAPRPSIPTRAEALETRRRGSKLERRILQKVGEAIGDFGLLEEGDRVMVCVSSTCGLPDQQRQVVKRMLTGLATDHPGLKTQMLAAMKNVKAQHLLDRSLLDRLRSTSPT